MYNYEAKRVNTCNLKDRSKIGDCILHNLHVAIPKKAGIDL